MSGPGGAARAGVEPAAVVRLREWQTVLARGITLASPEARALAERLSSEGKLVVRELRAGLEIEASSYVGRVDLGEARIIVEPKLEGDALLSLFRYAHGLRDLELLPPSGWQPGPPLFVDLVVAQLCAEAADLLSRGLGRRYVERIEPLSSPRGRIDLTRMLREGGPTRAALPCRHHARTDDWPLNRALRAGLELGASVASDGGVREGALRLASRLAETVSSEPLSPPSLARARASLDRLSWAYAPALSLVELLADGSGTPPGPAGAVRLPGFLFDMNRFFQALLGRFLRESLGGLEVREERALGEMLRYAPGHNPRGRPAPRPRPDFAVLDRGRVVALLDAKYRDLWAQPLPREMLYQLAMYALSQGAGGAAAILYPSLDPRASEARIELREPLGPWGGKVVVLRPVPLAELAHLLSSPASAEILARRERLARRLALGLATRPEARARMSGEPGKPALTQPGECVRFLQHPRRDADDEASPQPWGAGAPPGARGARHPRHPA